jgi:hypothetical protein
MERRRNGSGPGNREADPCVARPRRHGQFAESRFIFPLLSVTCIFSRLDSPCRRSTVESLWHPPHKLQPTA